MFDSSLNKLSSAEIQETLVQLQGRESTVNVYFQSSKSYTSYTISGQQKDDILSIQNDIFTSSVETNYH